MARIPKPWYREDRQAWFATVNGKRHNLGPDEKEAKRKFHEIMAQPEAKSVAPTSQGYTVAEIFEKFLEWCSKHRSAKTYQWTQYRIQMFIEAATEAVKGLVTDLKVHHVSEWIDTHVAPTREGVAAWSATYRRGIIIAIQRPLNWAVKRGYISVSPLRDIDKPSTERREQVITPEVWPTIRDHYAPGDPFRNLLEFSWETGCRPEEVKKIEARHVQIGQHRIVFPKEESKGKKKPRVIYMTPHAEAIIKPLIGNGVVFLNADGKQWTSYAINCRFCRLKKHLGTKFCAYSFRHGFGTRKLVDGLDHLTVAALMGHTDGTMLAKFYSHIGEREDYLLDKLNSGNDNVLKN